MIGTTGTRTRSLPGTQQEIICALEGVAGFLDEEGFTSGSSARFTADVRGECWTCPHCKGQGCAVTLFSERKMPTAERCRFRCRECGGTWDMEGG